MAGRKSASRRRSLETEMRQLGKKLDALIVSARGAKGGMRARSLEELRKLKARQAAAQKRLARLARQSAAASGPLKVGLRKAWRDMRAALRAATRRFRETS